METGSFESIVSFLHTISRFANMVNLCVMLHLFGSSEITGSKTDKAEGFLNWMFFEMLMIISTISATVLFMVIRAFDRGAIEFDDPDGKTDYNKDYIGAPSTQLKLTFVMMGASPAISNTLFLMIYAN